MAWRHGRGAACLRHLRTGGRCVRPDHRPFPASNRRKGRARRLMESASVLDFAGMSEGDLAALRRAVALLEHPGLAARLTNIVGNPIELIRYAHHASASQAIT